jgi:hypothetical protein
MYEHLRGKIKFQKALALAASASNGFEVAAAEHAARRLMAAYSIDPVAMPNYSLYNGMRFGDNALLKKLRDEWRAAHPDYFYGKPDKHGSVRRLRRKPRKRKPATPDPVNMYEGMFDDYVANLRVRLGDLLKDDGGGHAD